MNFPDRRITRFIKRHHLLTLCTSEDNKPYAASCFYIYIEEENALIVASDSNTKHMQQARMQNIIAGTIATETIFTGRIKGIQFIGRILSVSEEDLRLKYIKRFPVAMFMPLLLWRIDLSFIKMTDNSLGFGKKIIWEADAPKND